MKAILSRLIKGVARCIQWVARSVYVLLMGTVKFALQIAMALIRYLIRRYMRLFIMTLILILIQSA